MCYRHKAVVWWWVSFCNCELEQSIKELHQVQSMVRLAMGKWRIMCFLGSCCLIWSFNMEMIHLRYLSRYDKRKVKLLQYNFGLVAMGRIYIYILFSMCKYLGTNRDMSISQILVDNAFSEV